MTCLETLPESLKKKKHISFTVTGTGITGLQWLERLEKGNYEISEPAKKLLSHPGYDANHRLVTGREYTVTLVTGKEIRNKKNRNIPNLLSRVKEELSKTTTGIKAEFVFLIREKFTNDEMEAMNISYIAVVHEFIDGVPHIFRSCCGDRGRSIVSDLYLRSSFRWQDRCAFAFTD